MCCFSRAVRYVGNTQIFCRVGPKGSQVVIYSMDFEADEELAMVLPVPVRAGAVESDLKFINLHAYPEFFGRLEQGFPEPRRPNRSKDGPFGGATAVNRALQVQAIGSFEASFVPSVTDFSRLDARFRLPAGTFDKLPEYADHGFAVFTLRAQARAHVHPMAFAFPTRDPSRIIFPTVHIHDGEFHAEADFDHTLYCQSNSRDVAMNWRESAFVAKQFINVGRAKLTVRPGDHVFRRSVVGKRTNEDIAVPA